MRKVSKQELKYLSYQKDTRTWRQFYNDLYGECPWMETKQFGGAWLDQKMNEPLHYPNNTPHESN